MRTVTVDGIKCEVHSCQDCPCCEVDDYGVPSECKHPLNSEIFIYPRDEDGQQEIIRHGGKASADRCLLKEAVKERYGDKLAEMMAEKAYMEHFTRVRE